MTALKRRFSDISPTGWQIVFAAAFIALCYTLGICGLIGIL